MTWPGGGKVAGGAWTPGHAPAMTWPAGDNMAGGGAWVGVQAQAIHGAVTNYQIGPDDPPERTFHIGVNYLDARMPGRARELIGAAYARGHCTDEVRFHWLLALLSGRTLRQLSSEDLDAVAGICAGITRLAGSDAWTAGLRAVLRLLGSLRTNETELAVKELDSLAPGPRTRIVDHLGVLLEGPMEDQLWIRSVELARAGQLAGERAGRAWMFFHPDPAPPRLPVARPATVPPWVWLRTAVGAVCLGPAAVGVGWLLARHGAPALILGWLLALAGLATCLVTGARWHFLVRRRQAKDAEFWPRRVPLPAVPDGGFARRVDQLFDRYFNRYVPRGTDRAIWVSQTVGLRERLRDEVVESYREQRVDAEEIAWFIRHLVTVVRQRWESDNLAGHRRQLRTPWSTRLLCLAGLAGAVGGGLPALGIAIASAPVPGAGWGLLAAAGLGLGVPGWLSISGERARAAADEAERAARLAGYRVAFDRWRARLARRPSDAEMAAWLECDRRILVDDAMRHYRLRPSQVIAHAYLEAPAGWYKRARVVHGPWRYSRYHLKIFLLTRDGVRDVDSGLDFEVGGCSALGRLNYRFEAVASVRVDGVATQRQTFVLTLVNGEPIRLPVSEAATDGARPGEDLVMLSRIAWDSSGLAHTLTVLEGVAAEGKEWIRHQHGRTAERLDELAETVQGLLD